MENDLDQRQRNVVVNAYEAKHAGSIEEGSEGEAEKRAQVAADLGEFLRTVVFFFFFRPSFLVWLFCCCCDWW